MAEISIPLDELFAQNGHVDTEPERPRVDPTRGVFITSEGHEIELSDKPVNSLIVERLMREGKPKIPLVEVVLLGKHRQLEPNPNHEGYKAQLAEWEAESNTRLAHYLFVVGVKGQPPVAFVEEYRTYFPDATEGEMKYLWVSSRVPNEDVATFIEIMMGRAFPTAKGVDESANFMASPPTDSP